MNELLESIKAMGIPELHLLMMAIEDRYAEIRPDWDVAYFALHKDPVLRRQELEDLVRVVRQDLHWHSELDCTE